MQCCVMRLLRACADNFVISEINIPVLMLRFTEKKPEIIFLNLIIHKIKMQKI